VTPDSAVSSVLFSGAARSSGHGRREPRSAPITEPTVAPLQSVSSPPITAIAIERRRSPSPCSSAITHSSALLIVCTAW
jgi:hypothetical protein